MPTNTNNIVRFNLNNVHYAPMTSGTEYGTPVKIPGAVSLKLDPNGESEQFYADGGVYYWLSNNAGYDGELEMALLPDGFRTYALGETADTNGVLVERSDAEMKPFALLFEFDGDKKHIRHVLYNCIASRPTTEGKTNEASKEVQTETLSLKAAPNADGLVKSRTGDGTTDAVYNSWYGSVYIPVVSN